ncbi:MAG: DUF6036 family nucleotidyltransferase [Polyangiaceae bacterium]
MFDAFSLRHALVGGIAVGIWGGVRATKDVDLYAELPSKMRQNIRQALERRDFEVPAMEEELERYGVFRSLYRPTNVFVDIFDAQNPLGDAILDRRKKMTFEGKVRWVAAAEDLALLKVFSDRTRDFEDLTKLISVSRGTLNMEYIENWVRDLDKSIGGDDVSDRLRRAREEADKRAPRKS